LDAGIPWRGDKRPRFVTNLGDEPAEAYVAIGAGFTATMVDGTAVGTPPWAL